MVWVDRQGTIGWQAAGIQPIRRNWSGVLPVPGDGRYEWDGFLPITSLPSEVNPGRGFIATANNFLMPKDYPYKDLLQVTWSDPFRASRIEEVLGSGRKFSVAEMVRLQNDDLSVGGSRAHAAAATRDAPESRQRTRARSAHDVGFRARQGFGAGRRLRDVAAPPLRQHARGGGPAPLCERRSAGISDRRRS